MVAGSTVEDLRSYDWYMVIIKAAGARLNGIPRNKSSLRRRRHIQVVYIQYFITFFSLNPCARSHAMVSRYENASCYISRVDFAFVELTVAVAMG